jgi:Lrp/AsnC family transcriptional regulator, leucine-responsive regulatory protein
MRPRQHLLGKIKKDRENAWYTALAAADRAVSAPKLRNPKLDSIDRRILKELQADGRISFTDLAPKVGLTTSPCLERVRRLERAGVIKGYTATLDPRALDAGMLVFVELSLTYTTPEIFAEFKRAIARLPEILECHLVSGDFDYLIKMRVPDMNAYRALLGQLLVHLPGVRNSKTLVVMEEVKETTRIPIADGRRGA